MKKNGYSDQTAYQSKSNRLYIIGSNQIGTMISLPSLVNKKVLSYQSVFLIDEEGEDILAAVITFASLIAGIINRAPTGDKNSSNMHTLTTSKCLVTYWKFFGSTFTQLLMNQNILHNYSCLSNKILRLISGGKIISTTVYQSFYLIYSFLTKLRDDGKKKYCFIFSFVLENFCLQISV